MAFASGANNLVSGDTNNTVDVFVHDRQSGVTARVSVASGGEQPDAGCGSSCMLSSHPLGISADGRFVAFASEAANLVSGDTNDTDDVFVHDRQSGATTRVSVASGGAQVDAGCGRACSPFAQSISVSADGRLVAFVSRATNLVSGDTNDTEDAFVHDRQTGATTRVSVASTGAQADAGCNISCAVSVTADGRFVAFVSSASNLVSGNTNSGYDVFVRDRQSAATTRVSVASSGAPADGESRDPYLSADGRFVAFSSLASNLADGDTNSTSDVFVHEMGVVGAGITPAETFGGGNPAGNQTQCSKTEYPINCATGNFWHTFADIEIPGRGVPLALSRTYNALGVGADGPFGFGWASTYTMALTLDAASGDVTTTQENGSQVAFESDGAGGFTAPPRVLAQLVRQGDGSFVFTRRKQEVFVFSAGGRLTALRDLNGYTTTLTYDAGGRLTSVSDPSGRSLAFGSGADGRLSTVTDPLGRSLAYSYDGAGNLISVVDVAGGTTGLTYDAAHRLLTMTDPKGGVVTNVYDTAGRVTSQEDQLGRETTFAYSATGTTITDPKGNVEVQEYTRGQLTGVTKGLGTPQAARWTHTHDQATLGLTSTTDPNGNTTSMTYDSSGNRESLTDPLGRRSTATHDSLDNVTSVTDPNGVTTTMTYDGAGNLLSVATPLVGSSPPVQKVMTNRYDVPARPGEVTSRTDPDGFTWTYQYDAAGNQVGSTNPAGDTTTQVHDAIGWVTAMVAPKGNVGGTDPAAHTTSYDHDAFGQVIAARDPLWSPAAPTEHRTVRRFDANRNLDLVIDGNDRRTTYSYNAANEVTAVTRADGSVLTSEYWPDGTLRRQVDAAGKTTVYEYDPLGRVSSVTDPLGRRTTNGYDRAGNQVAKTDPGGDCSAVPKQGCTTSTYDAAKQLKTVTYSDGTTPNITNVDYDAAGQRLGMTDGTGTSRWVWDSLHRLRQSTDGAGKTVGYEYDLRGNVTRLTYPGGRTVPHLRRRRTSGQRAGLARQHHGFRPRRQRQPHDRDVPGLREGHLHLRPCQSVYGHRRHDGHRCAAGRSGLRSRRSRPGHLGRLARRARR